jgi:hypothetical protein
MPALVLVSAILLVLGVLAYRRTISDFRLQIADSGNRRRTRVGGAGLLVLRLVVLLLFAAVFVGAVFTRVWTERPRRVAIVLDVSESMSAVGAESAAAAVAEAFPLPTGAAQQSWAFGDTARPISDFRLQIADSQNTERTRIGAALKTVGKTRPGAVVLLSDGQDNGEMDPVAAAHDIGVPVYAVGFGGVARRNAGVEQVLLPAVVYSGETVEVRVRVMAAGFPDEKTQVRLRGETKEVVLGQAMAEQDVPFRLVFDKPGRQVIEARLDSLTEESNYADNTRSVTVDVRPGRLRVVYVTNRPGPGTRMMLRALAGDERIEVESLVAVSGAMSDERGALKAERTDVFILDDVVETGGPEVWQSIADRVRAGAGMLVLAGPDFQPGQSIGGVLSGVGGRGSGVGGEMKGSFTPELTAEGGVLPWFDREAIDLGAVPPFAEVRPMNVAGGPTGTGDSLRAGTVPERAVWLVAQENSSIPLVLAGKAGKGKFVYVAAYPLWRWGFGPEEKSEQATSLSGFVTGVVRYLAERDTSPFWLQVDRPDLYRGQPVRLTLRAVAPDGRPWTGLNAIVRVTAETTDSVPRANSESRNQNPEVRSQAQKPETVTVPMTETGAGVYEATIEALGPGRYQAVATVGNGDSPPERSTRGIVSVFLGKATTEFAVAEQALELANTGMNEGMLRAISEASGGRLLSSDSLPRDGSEIVLGSYQRRFAFDPRRAVWAYVLIALLAGAEWLLRRRRGLL